jgi:hypothetical protein
LLDAPPKLPKGKTTFGATKITARRQPNRSARDTGTCSCRNTEHRTAPAAYCPGSRRSFFSLIFLFQGHGMVVCPCTAPRKRLGFPWRVRFGFGHCRSPFRRCRTDMRFPVIEPRRQQRAMDAACVSCVEKETNPSGILVSSSLPANRRTAPYIYIYVTRCDQPLSSF